MLRRLPLAASICLAATLAMVASGSAGAQSSSSIAADDQPEIVAPQALPEAAAEGTTVSEEMAPAKAMPTADEAAPKAKAAIEAAPPAPAGLAAPAAPVVELDPLVAEVRQRLAASGLPDATAAERAALAAFYGERSALIWVTADGFTERARHAMAEIGRADDWGLDDKAFALPRLDSAERSPAALADAEIKLSIAVLKYARYARGGRLDPSQVSRNFDQKPTLRDPKVVLETVAGVETPGSYLRALHPKHPQFELLRQALLKTRAEAGRAEAKAEAVVQLPEGPTLKLGMEHADVALLRRRLKLAAPSGAENLYDQEVYDAVAEYQRKRGMRADGVLGSRTRTSLNGTERQAPVFGSDEQRLIANMERWRWVPEDMGEFHVWDNVPEYEARVVKQGQVIHQFRIIVGKPETQTTIFSANMRYVIFGPEWGVPDSIKVKEILPYLRPSYGEGFFGFGGGITDTRVLERHNLRVSYNGRPVDASQIDWSQADIRKFNFIQPSGPGNVLGAVKFRFPNKHDIYMHDTPQRELFDRTARTFSHGCVRVHNPGRLAEVLLEEDKGWSAARVREMMARGGNVEVALSKQIPVHITYFTAMASEDGQVRSFPDVYGHDKRVAAALTGRPMPLEAAPTVEAAAPKRTTKEARRRQRVDQDDDDLFSGLFGN